MFRSSKTRALSWAVAPATIVSLFGETETRSAAGRVPLPGLMESRLVQAAKMALMTSKDAVTVRMIGRMNPLREGTFGGSAGVARDPVARGSPVGFASPAFA